MKSFFSFICLLGFFIPTLGASAAEKRLPCAEPGHPTLVSPASGSAANDSTPFFDWNPVDHAVLTQIQLDDNLDFSSPAADVWTTGSSYTPSSLLVDGTYSWRVRGRNNDSGCDVYGPWSRVWTIIIHTLPVTPPAAPGEFSVEAFSDSQTLLKWTDRSNDEAGFAVERSVKPDGPWVEIARTDLNAAVFLDGGLKCNTLYHYRVRAFNAGGYSVYSGPKSHTTGACVSPLGTVVVPYIENHLLQSHPCGVTNVPGPLPGPPLPLVDSTVYFKIKPSAEPFREVYFVIDGEATEKRALSAIQDPLNPKLYQWDVYAVDGSNSGVKILSFLLKLLRTFLSVPGTVAVTPDNLIQEDPNARLSWKIDDIILVDPDGKETHHPGPYPEIRTIHDRTFVRSAQQDLVSLQLRCDVGMYAGAPNVDLLLTDLQGRRLGRAADNIYSEIPNSYYTGPDAAEEFIVIYAPQQGAGWRLNVTGTGSGAYTLIDGFLSRGYNRLKGAVYEQIPTASGKVDIFMLQVPLDQEFLPFVQR